MEKVRLSDVLSVNSRFGRSVNVERDFYSDRSIEGYVLTSTARHALDRLVTAVMNGGQTRSWTLTGPYGSGKSTFGLFAAKLFDCTKKSDRYFAQDILEAADQDLYSKMMGVREQPIDMFSILVSGSREPIAPAIVRGIRTAIERAEKAPSASLKNQLAEIAANERISGREIVQLIDAVQKWVKRHYSAAGVLLMIDELGKLLEYAAIHFEESDIFILQEIAEAANDPNRSLYLLTSLHQSFDQYAWRLNRRDREEWMKVQGRFEDIAFQEPNEQLLYILEGTFAPLTKSGRSQLEDKGTELANQAWDLGLCGNLDRTASVALLGKTVPLHPLVVLTLGPIFRRFGQNERSLFAFLTSDEPFGLKDFLRMTYWTAEDRPVLTLDIVYDHLLSALGSSLYIGAEARRWSEIDTAINRLGDTATQLEVSILKTVGLLLLIGDKGLLRPTREILRFALADNQRTNKQIDNALSSLVEKSILIERRFNNTFAIWEGSDINIEERLSEAERHIDPSVSIADILRRDFKLRPIVAKRHSHETGTLRYYEIEYAEKEDAEEIASRPLGTADGRIVYLLSKGQKELAELEATLGSEQWKGKTQVVFALLGNVEKLKYWVLREACCKWVRDNTSELEGDRSARMELAAQKTIAEQQIASWITEIQNVSGATSDKWFWRGQKLETARPRDVQVQLSRIFDEVFAKGPKIHNELINRNWPSTAAVTGRKKLLEAMLENSGHPTLGIEGTPAQLGIFLSVLSDTSLYRNEDGSYGFYRPLSNDTGISALWEAAEEFLARAESNRRPLTEFFEVLTRPPFGVKAGLLPIILTSVLLHFDTELALYEQGNFVPKLSLPILERLMRNPQNFELHYCRIAGARIQALQNLIHKFSGGTADPNVAPSNLLTLVRPLMRFAGGLDHYTRYTHNLSDTAQKIRQALISAREPDALLFKHLPEACGVEQLRDGHTDPEIIEAFSSELFEGIAEIKRAYEELMNRVESMLRESLHLNSTHESLRIELTERAAIIEPHIADVKLKSFVIRVRDQELDGRSWLESLASLLAGKPPKTWLDEDITRLQINLTDIARSFTNLERVMFATRSEPEKNGASELVRLSLTRLGQIEHERIISLNGQDISTAAELEARIEDALKSAGVNGNIDLRLSVLTRMALKLLDNSHAKDRKEASTTDH